MRVIKKFNFKDYKAYFIVIAVFFILAIILTIIIQPGRKDTQETLQNDVSETVSEPEFSLPEIEEISSEDESFETESFAINPDGTGDIHLDVGETSSRPQTAKTIKPTSISLNKSSLTVTKGNSYKLQVNFNPTITTERSITWNSSNKKAAKVSADGTIKGINAGKTTITATTTNGKTAKCEVTIKIPKISSKSMSIAPDKSKKYPATRKITYLGKTWTYSRIDDYYVDYKDGFGKILVQYKCRYHTNNRTGERTENCIGQHYGVIFCAYERGGEKELLKHICSNCHRMPCPKIVSCNDKDRCHGGVVYGFENCHKKQIKNNK